MYVPRHFSQDDAALVHGLIRGNVFATLVTEVAGRPDATHVPVILDEHRGELGTLRFHLAKANPAAGAITGDREVLMIFTGPHAYISPDWYANDDLVPTWNYAVVHAYGKPRELDDAGLRSLLVDLSASQEQRLAKSPWTMDKMPAELVERMCRVIAGFELPIDELQGKWKLNQNRGADDRAGVIAALEALGGEANLAVAESMRSLT